ncbi:MAG: hypothetical protein GY794_04750, partial [bacterium]|nr:hypothetical protein [bacterium]
KAVHWSNNSTLGTPATDITIGGVTFLAGPFNGTVDGVTNMGNASGAGTGWQTGPTTDDAGLDDILNSFIIGADGAMITIAVENGTYKLQLMFYDPFLDTGRGVDMTVEGVLVFDDYFLTAEQGGDALSGSVASHVFTVEDGQVDILFDDVKNVGAYFLSGLILNTASAQATNPCPADTATDVSALANLSWVAGYAVSHDIYFGTDPTPDAGEFQGNNSGNTYVPTLSPNT